MNNNQTASKPDPKGKAIASFILGSISILPAIPLLIAILRKSLLTTDFLIVLIYAMIGMGSTYRVPLIPLLGVILGVMGLKSTKKSFAIIGLILSLIGLATSIYVALLVAQIATQ